MFLFDLILILFLDTFHELIVFFFPRPFYGYFVSIYDRFTASSKFLPFSGSFLGGEGEGSRHSRPVSTSI